MKTELTSNNKTLSLNNKNSLLIFTFVIFTFITTLSSYYVNNVHAQPHQPDIKTQYELGHSDENGVENEIEYVIILAKPTSRFHRKMILDKKTRFNNSTFENDQNSRKNTLEQNRNDVNYTLNFTDGDLDGTISFEGESSTLSGSGHINPTSWGAEIEYTFNGEDFDVSAGASCSSSGNLIDQWSIEISNDEGDSISLSEDSGVYAVVCEYKNSTYTCNSEGYVKFSQNTDWGDFSAGINNGEPFISCNAEFENVKLEASYNDEKFSASISGTFVY